jgi:hypothetical protein
MSTLYKEQIGVGLEAVRVRVEGYDLGHVKVQAGVGTYVCIDLPVQRARELAAHLIAAADASDVEIAKVVAKVAA